MDRPYTLCHMVTSVDGKTLSARWGKLPGGLDAGKLFNATADRLDAPSWLVGTTTMREFAHGRVGKLKAATAPAGDSVADAKAESLAIGVDAHGVLRFDRPDVNGDHTVVLTTTATPPAYRAHLRAAGVSCLLCGSAKVDLRRAVGKLHEKFGLERLCVQGGGTLNGSMLRAGLVDEISQVVVPVVDGGGRDVTGFFDPPGKPAKSAVGALELLAHERLDGGAQWFRWRVRPAG